MSVTVTGVLPTPIVGQAAAKATIRFTSLTNEDSIILGAPALVVCDKDGNYDFGLNVGTFKLEINYYNGYEEIGTIVILETSEFTGTLGELINQYLVE